MRVFHFVMATAIVGDPFHGELAAQGVATYSKEAMDDLVVLLRKATKEGYAMQAGTTTMFGGWLPKGQAQGGESWVSMLVLTDCDPNYQYRIIAAGDNDTKDLDVRVVDPEGKIVGIDNTVLRDAETTFRPTRRQSYTIQLRLYHSADNCVCLGAILRK